MIHYTIPEIWQIGWPWHTAWVAILGQIHGHNFRQLCFDLKLWKQEVLFYLITQLFTHIQAFQPVGWCISWQLQLHTMQGLGRISAG